MNRQDITPGLPVTVVSYSNLEHPHVWLGCTGVVLYDDGEDEFPIHVRMDGGDDYSFFDPEELEELETTPVTFDHERGELL